MERLLQEIRDGILELQRRIPPPEVPVEVPPVPPCRVPPVVPEVPAPPAPPAPPPMRVELSLRTIIQLANAITSVLQQLPNRLELIEIDTSDTTQRSLREEGKLKPAVALGFEIESVGGGFNYVVVRKGLGKDERNAIAGATWNIEYDDLLITGSGATGTARLWYWWREPVIIRD